MEHDFVDALLDAFKGPGLGVLLGCRDHGQICMESLANSFGRISAQVKIQTVLVEGYREHGSPPGALAPFVAKLESAGVMVKGIENDQTEPSLDELDKAMARTAQPLDDDQMQAALSVVQHLEATILDDRIPMANAVWARMFLQSAPPVVMCCGASHLPPFMKGGEIGLEKRLGGNCRAFAVVDDVQASDQYTPELNRPGTFGSVRWIHAVR